MDNRFVYFGRNSSLHGLRHIFKEKSFIIARLFWISIVLLSSGCMYLILVPMMERGDEVNFTPDTRYLTWTTTFPAVTVCETFNFKMAQRKFATLYPDLMEPLNYDFRKYLTELTYGKGTCSRSLCVPCGATVPCDVPWREVIGKIHKKCTELISECSFNGQEFPCCKKFRVVDSEYGACYSFNTLQNENSQDEVLYTVNLTTGPGLLKFHVLADTYISVHSPEELATNILDDKFKFVVRPNIERKVEYLFSMVEVENDPMLQLEDTAVRQCRYLEEIPEQPIHNYQVYSYGACRLALDTKHFLEQCRCVHPVRNPEYKHLDCNFTGMNCLVYHAGLKLKAPEKHVKDFEECLPSCVESELTTIHVFRSWIYDASFTGALVNVRMSSLPTLRFKRNLIRTDLDFVVSIGDIVGLFFAASVLSVVEIFYLICRKQKLHS